MVAANATKSKKSSSTRFLTMMAIILLAIIGNFIIKNPLLFGRRTTTKVGDDNNDDKDKNQSHQHKIYKHSQEMDDEFFPLAKIIGTNDFTSYRNHCLRVLTFTNYFLPEFVEKEFPSAMSLAAVAIVYHDVALWTDKELNYLHPSAEYMKLKLVDHYTEEEMNIMIEIIMQHHKITEYTSSASEITTNKVTDPAAIALIEAVRKADWTDATMGVRRFGMPSTFLEQVYDEIPEAGFHEMLLKMGKRLSPDNFLGQFDSLKILRW